MESQSVKKFKVSITIFILTGLLLSHHQFCQAVGFTEKTFIKVEDPGFGVERLGLPWSAESLTDCYVTCWSKYSSKCQTILYNTDTKLCTPGSFIRSGAIGVSLAATSKEGDLFATSNCDISNDFTYVTSVNASACMKVSSIILSPNDAAEHCLQLGAHLFVARTFYKLDLLPSPHRLIIGLSDQASEGTFVWPDNGDPIPDDYKTLFFASTEPNDLGNEDCVTAIGKAGPHTGNDIPCTFKWWRFVCERPMFGQ